MLQKLEIDALRGATKKLTLDFEKGKRISIIYGENASGKSTICDAVELLAKGKISSLDGKGLGKTESYWHSTGKKQGDILVTLTTTGGKWTAKLVKSKTVVTPDDGRPQAAILRRSEILRLIAEQPKNRFDAIRPFLDIQTVEDSEASLKRLVEQERLNRETAVTRIEENRVAIENFWKTAGSPGADAIDWARQELSKDTTLLGEELNRLEKLIKQIESLVAEQARLDTHNFNIGQAEKDISAYSELVEKEHAKLHGEISDTVNILNAAKEYFHKHENPEKCPLCGSKEFANGLSQRVASQLDDIKSLTSALRLQGESQKKLDIAKLQASQERDELLSMSGKLAAIITPSYLPAGLTFPKDLQETAKRCLLKDADLNNRLQSALEITAKAAAVLPSFKMALDERKEKKGLLQTLKLTVETYDKSFAAQKELDILVPRLEKALTEIVAERHSFVDSILKQIASRVGELYESIHPGEGLSKISLLLDPSKRASLDILGKFPGAEDVPPGAYFSDSHLDTLGLCIWLALAELGDAKNTILVLDDVVGSVDEPHVDRVISLLYDMAQKFQHCIFTTHYRPWREKYRWGWLQTGQCHFVELLKWQHDIGIKHCKCLPPLDELRVLLQSKTPSEQQISASAGVILEAVLDFFVHLYECAVPQKKSRPTLGDLLPSVRSKLRTALKIERRVLNKDGTTSYEEHKLGPLLDELEKIAQARNVFGCHFSEIGQHLPQQDAIHFAELVLTLADLIIDAEFGWPRSDKSGSYWSNSEQTRRLHPLKQPS